MDYQQAERASAALAEIVESIADRIENEFQLSPRVEGLRQRAGEIRADRFSVLVVGEFKRGKSTVLNAMMGDQVLPQKVAPCTAVVTVIAFGDEKQVRVRFAAAPGEDPPADEHLTIEEFQHRYALQATDAALDDTADGSFDRFSTIEHARIEYPVELCRHRVELVDSPGLGEHRVRTERTQGFLDRVDAIVMVLDATQLLREEELHFLENVLLPRGLKNIFFVVNKWNLIENQVLRPEEAEASYRELDVRLREKLGPFCVIDGTDRSSERVFRINALGALKARLTGQVDPGVLEATGMPAFEAALQRFLVDDRGRARRDLVMAQLRNTLDGVQRHIESQIALAEKSIDEIEHDRISIAPKLERLRDIKRDTEEFLREKSTNLQDRLVVSFKDHIDKIEQDVPNAVKGFGLGDLTHSSLWKLVSDWTREEDNKFAKKLERHLRPQVERYFEKQLANWQVVVNRYEMDDVAIAVEERLNRYAEEYLRVLAEIETTIGVEHSALPEIKTLVASWLGANERMLGGQGGFVADTKLAIVGDLTPVFAALAADLAFEFVGATVPVIGLIVTGWRLYVREQNMQRDMTKKIVAEMRKQLRLVENTQAAIIRDRVAEGFGRLREGVIDGIERDIAGIDESLQDIIDRKQAREYSAQADQERMRAARSQIAEDIQSLETANVVKMEAIVAQRKTIRRHGRSHKGSVSNERNGDITREQERVETIISIADFSAGLSDMIGALDSAHGELDALEVGRPRSLDKLAQTIHDLREQQSRGLRAAVFGGFSSGKSTLINALLGIDHLVVGVQATTASVTSIRRSADGNESALVRFKTVADFSRELWEQVRRYHADLIDAVDGSAKSEGLIDAFDPLSRQFPDGGEPAPQRSPAWLPDIVLPLLRTYVERVGRSAIVPPAERRADWDMNGSYLRLAMGLDAATLTRLGTEDRLTLEDLESVLAKEETAVCVDRVDLRLNAALLEGDLEIVDTPGLGSLHARHTRRSESFVKDVDALLYVLPERGVGKDDVEFLALLERRNEVLNENKVFFAANMVDKCIDDDAKYESSTDAVIRELEQHAERITEDLSRHFQSPRVLAVAAETARLARTALEGELSRRDRRFFDRVALWYDGDEQPDPATNLELSGIPALNATLETYLVEQGVRVRVDQARGRIGSVLKRISADDNERLQLMAREQKDLGAMRLALRESKRKITGEKAGKRERARKALIGLITTTRVQMVRQIELVLGSIVNPVTDAWMAKRSQGVYLDAAAYGFTWLVNLFREEKAKSSLESYIGAMVERVLQETMEAKRTNENLEAIQNELLSEAAASISASLREISDELAQVRSPDGRPSTSFELGLATSNSYDGVLISVVEQKITNVVTAVVGGTIGVFVLDVFLTFGVATIIAAIVAALFGLARDKEIERQNVADKIRKALQGKKSEILRKTVEEKLCGVEQELLRYFDSEVDTLINGLEDEIDQAERDLTKSTETREHLKSDHKRVDQIMQSLRQRLDATLPEMG